jgi:hypothetical protein
MSTDTRTVDASGAGAADVTDSRGQRCAASTALSAPGPSRAPTV